MPENLYPQLPTVPPISQESFNIEMVRKYYQDIAKLKELESNGNIRIPIIDYYMHPPVQVLLL